ncbi:hypothetical protein BKA80DRAFT_67320 [Phyllosticta citrichinensis]
MLTAPAAGAGDRAQIIRHAFAPSPRGGEASPTLTFSPSTTTFASTATFLHFACIFAARDVDLLSLIRPASNVVVDLYYNKLAVLINRDHPVQNPPYSLIFHSFPDRIPFLGSVTLSLFRVSYPNVCQQETKSECTSFPSLSSLDATPMQ